MLTGRINLQREKVHSPLFYTCNGQHVCQKTYQFFLGIGKDRLKAVKESYLSNALITRVHENTGKLLYNGEGIQDVVQFVSKCECLASIQIQER